MCNTEIVNNLMDNISRPQVTFPITISGGGGGGGGRKIVKPQSRVVPIDGVEEFQGATLLTELDSGILYEGYFKVKTRPN